MTGGSAATTDNASSREQIRAEMTDALAKFTPTDRAFAGSITTRDVSIESIHQLWVSSLRQLFIDLEETASEKRVRDYIAKHFQFPVDQVSGVIDSIVEMRMVMAIETTVTKLFREQGQAGSEQHTRLIDYLLTTSIGVIDAYFDRAHAYTAALTRAETDTISLCDPHGSWLERQRCALQIHKERSQVEQTEEMRLDEISAELAALTTDSDSPESRIIAMDWQYVQILDLRQTYLRQIDKLPKTDRSNPTKMIRLFEKTTKEFRENETERLTTSTAAKSLKNIRDIQETVYDLLLEVFDLSNTERNRVLKTIQRYTSLRQERDMILLLRRNREQFLSTSR